jgi:hypothetical protein
VNHYSLKVSLADCPPRRRTSALLFGNRHKLELMAALATAEDGRVNLSLLADGQGVPPSVYYSPIRDLITAGLAARLTPVQGDRRRWYARTENDLWESIRALAGHVTAMEVAAS